jgi:DegV family protein with EDD domain
MVQSTVEIITDSTCDIPQNLVDQYKINVIPHYVIWGDRQYLDRVNLQPEEFYARLETEKTRPTSAQATVMDYLKTFEQAIERGVKEIVVVTVSSAMSGAYQCAVNAAAQVKIPVHVVDSKGPTMTLGWQVLAAARVQDAGGDVRAMLSKMDQIRQTMTQIVSMDTMEFLQHGGRIGDAAKWIGSMLSIKPVVSINHVSGRVEPVGLSRTHHGAVELMYQRFFEKMDPTRKLRVAVLHGNIPNEAQSMAERIKKEFSPVEIIINITGPVLGINTGPRAMALCGYTE